MLEGLLLHSIMMPHIFGFLPIIVGALAGLGAGAVIGGAGLTLAGLTIGTGAVLGSAGALVGYSGMKAAGAAREQANRANDATERRYWYDVENWAMQTDKIKAEIEGWVKDNMKTSISLTEEATGSLRQWLNIRNNGYQTHFAIVLIDPKVNQSIAETDIKIRFL